VELAAGSVVVSSVIELCVGVACLLAAAGTWQRPGLRVWAGIFMVAGVAAALHALIALL
jgi:hypothetical protein